MRPDRDLAREASLGPAADAQPALRDRDAVAPSVADVPAGKPRVRIGGSLGAGRLQRAESASGASGDGSSAVDPYLVRALRAAAAAKAAAARIRASEPADPNPGPARSARPAWAEGRAPPPGLAEPTARGSFAEPAPANGGDSAPLPARGLSIAEAAAASTVVFRPISDKAIRPRFRGGFRPIETEPVAEPEDPAPAEPRPEGDLPQHRPDPATASPAADPEQRRARDASEPRFARTVAEVERQQVEQQAPEPWGQMVLRPATPRANGSAARQEDEPAAGGLSAFWRRVMRR